MPQNGLLAAVKFNVMSHEEAKQIVRITERTFDIESSMFGDGSVTITIADVFDTEAEAQKLLEALRLLCS
jgi:hypothetical protein